MITYFQAIIIGGLQGLTELFPVSSLGHSVILPPLLGWNINQNANFYLIFLVATHLATSLVLFGFFFKDWMKIFQGLGRSLKNRVIDQADTYAKLGWLIIVATIPAGLLGLLLQEKLKLLFGSPLSVSIFLFLNGLVLALADMLRRRSKRDTAQNADVRAASLTWFQAIGIGFSQALALIPGFSRTGSTLGGGLLAGLDHEASARFSFLLATPIIFAAAMLKLPELLATGENYPLGPVLIGSLVSALAAYFSVKFLTKYFKSNSLRPFAAYCLIIGGLATLIFLIRQ